MKQLALTITTTLATLALILILWQLRSIVLLFLFSIFIASSVRTPIDRLIQRGCQRWLAIFLVYGLVVVGALTLVVLLAMPLATELQALTQDLAYLYEQGYAFMQKGATANSRLFARLPSTEVVGQFLLENQPAALASRVMGFTQSFAAFLGQAFLALVLSVYWTADQLHFERLWLSLLAPSQRTRMRELWYTLERNVGAYIRSEVLQSVLAGALLTAGYRVMGLEYPFLLAAIGAIAWFIPLAGALFAVPFIAALAFLNGPLLAIAAALYTIVIFVIMEFVLEPRLYDRSQYGVVLVIIVMMAMVEALGITGLLLAPPVALTLQIILDELLNAPITLPPNQRSTEKAPETQPVTWEELQAQFAELRTTLNAAETKSPRVSNMVDRLEQLLQETQEVAV
ncbi:MAG: AI-2E family transporter [Caldilineaceae bacterium]|nr:AI-2E family transporter [Caldilineaceae bacterium]